MCLQGSSAFKLFNALNFDAFSNISSPFSCFNRLSSFSGELETVLIVKIFSQSHAYWMHRV